MEAVYGCNDVEFDGGERLEVTGAKGSTRWSGGSAKIHDAAETIRRGSRRPKPTLDAANPLDMRRRIRHARALTCTTDMLDGASCSDIHACESD